MLSLTGNSNWTVGFIRISIYVYLTLCYILSTAQLYVTTSYSCSNLLNIRSSTSGLIYSNKYGTYSDRMSCNSGLYLHTPTWNLYSSDFILSQITITLTCTMADLPPLPWLDAILGICCLQTLQARPTSFLLLLRATDRLCSQDLLQVITVRDFRHSQY